MYEQKIEELRRSAQFLIEAIGFEESNYKRDASGQFASKSGESTKKEDSLAPKGTFRRIGQDIDSSEALAAHVNQGLALLAKAVGDLTYQPSKTPGADFAKNVATTIAANSSSLSDKTKSAIAKTLAVTARLTRPKARERLARELEDSKSIEDSLATIKGFVQSTKYFAGRDPSKFVYAANNLSRALNEDPLFQVAVGFAGLQVGAKLGAKAVRSVLNPNRMENLRRAQSAGKAARKAEDAANTIYKDVAHTYKYGRTTKNPGSATVNTTATRLDRDTSTSKKAK